MSLPLILACLSLLAYLLKKYFAGSRYKGARPNLSGHYAIVTGGAGGIGH